VAGFRVVKEGLISKMGSVPSVVVIHSSKVQQDREALLAVFPDKFQVEIQPNSGASLLVEERLTLILVPSDHSKGTCAVLVLEEDVIRQASERAVIYGISMEKQKQSRLNTTMVKLTLPGGATLLATTAELWKDSSARSTSTQFALTSSSVGNGNAVAAPDFLKRQKSPTGTLKRGALNPKCMKRSMSMPDIPPLMIPTQPTPMNHRLFPSLRVQVLKSQGRFVNFPLNSRVQVPVETELFVGNLLLTMRPNNPQDDPYWNDKIFSKKKRRVVMQLQGKLKYKPEGVLYAGMGISDPMNLGLLASGLCNM
jgi:hypothetical protein